ncbi:MAG: carboxypeptidase-like regulatory domain-containing protein, partial [Flavobacteriaceae bacterium]
MILTKTHYLIILFLLPFTFSFSQKKVTGTIVDENNMPLPGVNVLIKDTTTGTMTDFDGLYEIELPNNENVLTFSMVGMITQTVTVGEQTQLDIVLKSDITQLDEVVVVGYGTVARKDLTGAVSTVKSEDIELAPVANFDQALAGRIAGVTVTSGEGTPGAALNIVVRGGNSITGSNAPLYVINGIPLEDF